MHWLLKQGRLIFKELHGTLLATMLLLGKVEERARQRNQMPTLLQGFRYALGQLRKSPGYTVAALTVALGIRASSTIFSVVDAVLPRPLPFHNPSGLVAVKPTDFISNSASSWKWKKLVPRRFARWMEWSNARRNATICDE
jgi:hypothetical protein